MGEKVHFECPTASIRVLSERKNEPFRPWHDPNILFRSSTPAHADKPASTPTKRDREGVWGTERVSSLEYCQYISASSLTRAGRSPSGLPPFWGEFLQYLCGFPPKPSAASGRRHGEAAPPARDIKWYPRDPLWRPSLTGQVTHREPPSSVR